MFCDVDRPSNIHKSYNGKFYECKEANRETHKHRARQTDRPSAHVTANSKISAFFLSAVRPLFTVLNRSLTLYQKRMDGLHCTIFFSPHSARSRCFTSFDFVCVSLCVFYFRESLFCVENGVCHRLFFEIG